jgi:hypothetical protein
VDGNVIANNGTVHFRNGERVYLNYLFVKKFVGETCVCEVIRQGVKMSVSFPVISNSDLSLVPIMSPSNKPSYMVVGGLVFTRLTIAYMREYCEDDGNWFDHAPRALVHRTFTAVRESLDEEVVILAHVLADDINYGYSQLTSVELLKFNGQKVNNMKHLYTLIQENKEQFLRFDFVENIFVVLEKKDLDEASTRIASEYSLPAHYSEDLACTAPINSGKPKQKSKLDVNRHIHLRRQKQLKCKTKPIDIE